MPLTDPIYKKVSLGEEGKIALSGLFSSLPHPTNKFHQAFLGAMEGLPHLPPEILSDLSVLLKKTELPALLIDNLPYDENLPHTPKDARFSTNKETFYTEGCLLLFASFFGIPMAYANEKDGELIQTLCPVRSQIQKASSEGAANLPLHTDNAFHAYPPDYLFLACLKPHPEDNALTLISDIRSAVESLNETQRRLLTERHFIIKSPTSFDEEQKSDLQPIIRVNESGVIEARVRFDRVSSENPEATAALNALKLFAERNTKKIDIQPGQILILDNSRILHGRIPFDARLDGNDRWMYRLYTRGDIPSLWQQGVLTGGNTVFGR
jgi:alpha-ketoglutarate-dependent taurine dioxygenase